MSTLSELRCHLRPVMPALLVWMVLTAMVHAEGGSKAKPGESDSWVWNLASNIFSYAILVVPAALLIRHLRERPELINGWVQPGPGMLMAAARIFVFGSPEEAASPEAEAPAKKDVEANADGAGAQKSWLSQAIHLVICVVGLQGSYLTWGVLQERIMTRSYGIDEDGNEARFRNSQYLVFANRVLALVTAFVWTRATVQPRHVAPLYKYSFASMSNVMSSWCQYEALKYVNFPTQVLAKSCKVIPTMVMGKFVQSKTYPMYEYVSAGFLSAGVALFMLAKADEDGKLDNDDSSTNLSGIILLAGYLMFDSFTSNYQGHLFKEYKPSSYQVMFGVNLFSATFTFWSLLQQGSLMSAINFTMTYPTFAWHLMLLSLTSATGQIFIFRTLQDYGVLTFSIVMTRQVFSIFLSAFIYSHAFAAQAWFGICIVFGALFTRIYLRTASKPASGK